MKRSVPGPPGESDGDPRLAARLHGLLGPRHPVAAAAVVGPGRVDIASIGAPLDSDYEIGSITKGVTGMLYEDARARGEVGPRDRLGDHLPVGGSPVGGVPLAALATHRSGLPSLPASAQPLRRTVEFWRHGTNPYGDTLEQLLDQARGSDVGKTRPRYSNFGFELLGHAVASAAGTPYADLVASRVADPLGLERFFVATSPDRLTRTSLLGRSRWGRPQEPWTGEALGPAGGIRASISDMARLAQALLDGTAPGASALDPVASLGRQGRIGAAWMTTPVKGRSVTWHNGGTGGFRTWMGLDREAGAGVVILSATARWVDQAGFTLLMQAVREAS